ncbi:MAG: type II secretion system minor pseudopilin GspK [Hyphomonadaceae bacterium]|nr:type II secretion system minor pseudopilin GspK [Hyphomonadaceae bacterium]
MTRPPTLPRDRGAALVTVLVMVAIIAALAIVVVDAAGFALQRARNLAAMDQTRWYLRGAEAYAAARIETLLAAAPDGARLDEAQWQGKPFVFPLDDGAMTITLWDAGNCFNLNSLVAAQEGGGAYFASAQGQVLFARLLDLVGARGARDGALAAAAADWIDSDSEPGVGGAEDSAYAAAGLAYRTANTLIGDVSELRRVRGMTAEIAAALAPFVCVRPTASPNALNVNTLRADQAPLLAMTLSQDTSVARAAEILRARPVGGWESVDAFFQDPRVAALNVSEATRALFTVQPNGYVLMARVRRANSSEACAVLLEGRNQVRPVRRICGLGAAERIL